MLNLVVFLHLRAFKISCSAEREFFITSGPECPSYILQASRTNISNNPLTLLALLHVLLIVIYPLFSCQMGALTTFGIFSNNINDL